MKRPLFMVTLILVILFASFMYLLRGLALAALGGVASKIGEQAGGDLTVIAGVMMVISAVCAWAFADAVWNFKPLARAYGLIAANLALLSVLLNFQQGGTLNTELITIIAAVCITAYSIMHGMQLRTIRHYYRAVATYGQS